MGNAERVLLRGEAGSGKTTLLQWIAVTAARHGFSGELSEWNGRTPFIIRLRDYVKRPLPSPEHFLDVIASPIAGLMPPGWVHRQLTNEAILLVDGVDEVPENQRREVRDWLRGLLAAYSDLRVVVTSRPAAASARWLSTEGFTAVFLERMGPGDIKALIRHWHEAIRQVGDLPCEPHRLPSYEQRLLAQLDSSSHLHNLAANPLLCAMLCALNLDRDSNLPRNRMDIYQAAVDMLLKRRDEKRGVYTPLPDLTSRDQLQLLQQIAWWLTLNGRTELSRKEAEYQIGQRLAGIRNITASATEVLNHMLQRSGILREPVPDRIDFVHRTFQEYLAAREAAEQGHTGVLLERAHLDTWRETIILAAGHANAPIRNQLLSGLLERAERQSRFARKLRLLAAACLETAPSIHPQLLNAIRSRLRELAPRSIAEARSLAAVGEPLLSELPNDITTLTEARATATVRAAALVNGPAALSILGHYAADPRPRVQREIIGCWRYFDPFDYVDNVLADAPLDDGRVHIEDPAIIPALSRLNYLRESHIWLLSKLDIDELAEVPRLTRLFLLGSFTGEIEQLTRHTNLEKVCLFARQEHLELHTFTKLPKLTFLHLLGLAPDQDLSDLRTLRHLIDLRLGDVPIAEDFLTSFPKLKNLWIHPLAQWDTEILAPLANLDSLALIYAAEPTGGLTTLADQLSKLQQLTRLHLSYCEWVNTAEPLAKLKSVEQLMLDETNITDFRPLANCTQLRRLSIGKSNIIFDLTPLANLPHLDTLWIESSPVVDLTPLHGKRMTVFVGSESKLAHSSIPKGIRVKRIPPSI